MDINLNSSTDADFGGLTPTSTSNPYANWSDQQLIDASRAHSAAPSIENMIDEDLIAASKKSKEDARMRAEYEGAQGQVRVAGEGYKAHFFEPFKAAESAGDWISNKLGLPPRPNGEGAW